MHILENVEPDLAKQLHKLQPARGCQLLIESCNFVSSRISLDAELAELIARCKSGELLNEVRHRTLLSYAAAADERYFDLEDRGADEEDWLPWFQRARLATAYAKTSGAQDWENIADGFYELTVIFRDSSIIEFIKQSLPEVQA